MVCRNRTVVLTVLPLLAALVACAGAPPTARVSPLESVLGEGWQCYAAPDAFKKAGVVLEMTQDGRYYFDTDNSSVAVAATSALGDIDYSLTTNLGAVISLLKPIGVLARSSSSKAELSRTTTIQARYGGTIKHVVPGTAIGSITSALETRELPPTSRYFLVRESQSARSVDLVMDRSATTGFLAEASLDSALNAGTNLSRVGTSQYRLKRQFAEDLGICTLTYQLTVLRSADGTRRVVQGAISQLPRETVISQHAQ